MATLDTLKTSLSSRGRLPVYPQNHKVGMKVPKGGSSCAKCEHLAENKTDCTEKHFIEWRRLNGAKKPEQIPGNIDEYCSDFFEAK